MSRQSQHFVQRSFKFFLYICFISNISGSEPIPLDSFLNKIEVANDFQERKRGLMYRKALPQDQGMLFKWDSKKIQCMWMKNTSLELNIAFISNQGEILEIFDMIPFSVESICSSRKVKYALEVNKNWFKENSINVGDKINLSFINDQ